MCMYKERKKGKGREREGERREKNLGFGEKAGFEGCKVEKLCILWNICKCKQFQTMSGLRYSDPF